MKNLIVLVGTNHKYQCPDRCLPIEEIKKFYDFLIFLVQKHRINAIAEEMSIEALHDNDQIESIPFKVAQALDNIPHQYSDPEIDEQSKHGIMNEGVIELYGVRNGWPRQEIESRIEIEYRKREAVWLSKIKSLDKWPLLFICGSLHMIPLHNLLRNEGYLVQVEIENWVA
ncbi:MAG: hypothetical protein KJ687_09685 [Proteobacteria bacterium]|nr:hypothetical protein [Pseudomonadota bacterium]